MQRIAFIALVAGSAGLCAVGPLADGQPAPDPRPNILWITIEDWGPQLSCYGTKGIHTPHLDRLAAQGIRYLWAFTTAPVCSTSRSAMMTGFHQNYIGANQHREHHKKPLPHGIKPIPHLLQEAGYFTALMSRKVDVNFLPDKREQLFMGTDWSQRKPGQPFFARITFSGTHRPWKRDPQRPIDIDDVEIPPYMPTHRSSGATGPTDSSRCNWSIARWARCSNALKTKVWPTTRWCFSSPTTAVVTFAASSSSTTAGSTSR